MIDQAMWIFDPLGVIDYTPQLSLDDDRIFTFDYAEPIAQASDVSIDHNSGWNFEAHT